MSQAEMKARKVWENCKDKTFISIRDPLIKTNI